jgi:hypothetical protein
MRMPHFRHALLRVVTMTLSLSCLSLARAENSVTVINCEDALPHARIATLFNSQPLQNVNFTIYDSKFKKVKSFSADAQGQGFLPSLRRGRYSIVGWATNNLRGDLCLDIAAKDGKGKSSFTMQLASGPLEQPTLEDMLAAAENGVASERISGANGVVQDQVGTPIAGATILVYKKGVRNKAHAKQIRSDKSGQFTASLPDGTYTLFFEAPGFHYRIVVVEIVKTREGKGLQITLPIGEMTE